MKVFVGQPLVEPSTTEILAGHTVVTGGGNLPRSEWPLLHDADALLPTPREPITAEVLAASPRVRIVASHSVGVDHIDLAACRSRGILVTNTPDVLTDATADLAWALILAVARRIREGEALARSGTWDGWKPQELLGISLSGKTLGIYGMGRIGRAVARRGEAFGMRVLSFDRDGTEEELEEFLSKVDVLSIHAPLTEETRGRFGEEELLRMKKGAILDQHRARPDRGRRRAGCGPSLEASFGGGPRRLREGACDPSRAAIPARTSSSSRTSARRPSRRASRWRASRARRSRASRAATRRYTPSLECGVRRAPSIFA